MTQIVLTGLTGTTTGTNGAVITVNEMPPISAINKGIHVVGATGVALALTVDAAIPTVAEHVYRVSGNKIQAKLTTDLVAADSFILDCVVDGVFVRT